MQTFTNYFHNKTTGEVRAWRTRAHDLYEARREFLRYMREKTDSLRRGDLYMLITVSGAKPLDDLPDFGARRYYCKAR